MSDILSKLQQIESELPEYVKGAIKQMPILLQGYIGQEMAYQAYRKDGKYPKNDTNVLNIRSGALFKSFQRNNRNNVFEEHPDGFLLGSKLIYAAIHEYGGTINHPGGTPYIVTGKGALFMKKDGNYPEGVKFTKPHLITIKARPYLKPAEKRLEEEGIPQFQQMIFDKVFERFNE